MLEPRNRRPPDEPRSRHHPGVAWLLQCQEPAIRLLTLTDVLDERPDHPEVLAERRAAVSGPIVSALLQDAGVGVYHKWRGQFWRLTALTELGVATQEPEMIRCLDAVLEWFDRLERRGYPLVIEGRARAHAVWHGHALAAMVVMGRANDREAAGIARLLIRWQWADGGWNCDRRPGASCSSVHESLGPLWGLSAYHRATGDSVAGQATQRAAAFFLERRLFRSRRTSEVIHPAWLRFRHPAYYHYDVLQALWVLARAGYLPDPRAAEAVELLATRRRRDGRWNANGRWWKPPGRPGSNVEAADWGPSRPSPMVTLKALTIMAVATAKTAGVG